MPFLLIYPLVFFVLFLRERGLKSGHLFVGILFLYFIAGIACCLESENARYDGRPFDFFSIVFHCVCLIGIIYPFKKYEKFRNCNIETIPNGILLGLTAFFLFCGYWGILELAPQLNLASIVTDTQELRELFDENKGQDSYFSFFGSKYWTINLVLAFYYMRVSPKQWLIVILLFGASTCYLFDGLRFAGRECILKYAFVFLVLYYFVSGGIIPKYKKLINGIIVVGGLMGLALFAIITFMRFDPSQVSQDSSVFSSLISYIGQGFVNFSTVVDLFPGGLTHGTNVLPVLFGPEPSHIDTKGFDSKTFATTIGSWVKDMGILGALILTIVYNALLRVVPSIRCNLFTMFYVAWAYEFFFSILFFYNDVLNGSRLISLFCIIMLDVFLRNTRNKTVKRAL